MFIATMFSYGQDNSSVGVDGIRSCMGVFLHHAGTLYAIHVPDNPMRLAAGRAAFVTHVQAQTGQLTVPGARIYAVVNGNERMSAREEIAEYCRDLGIATATVVRLRAMNGTIGTHQDSVAVICERRSGTADCILKYQLADSVAWQQGVGTVRSGFYFNNSFTDVLSNSGAVSQGWNVVDESNAVIITSKIG
jgi:hypothetical protein